MDFLDKKGRNKQKPKMSYDKKMLNIAQLLGICLVAVLLRCESTIISSAQWELAFTNYSLIINSIPPTGTQLHVQHNLQLIVGLIL